MRGVVPLDAEALVPVRGQDAAQALRGGEVDGAEGGEEEERHVIDAFLVDEEFRELGAELCAGSAGLGWTTAGS